jgi:Zn-dependent protease/RNA polymerase subunit RPABC4/transcription elongation factor Spt4
MLPTSGGSFRLFRFAGIDVYLHWSWLIVALIEIKARAGDYSSPVWNVAEYLSLFGIVLLHEFGHALACRQVGGKAQQIVLWPLGGVAYVQPPPRPGAFLWSIAAGPLVNVLLLPPTVGLAVYGTLAGWHDVAPNVHHLLWAVAGINGILLAFNVLPIYPLDGGQILQAILWFFMGRARSLMVASCIGFVGVAGLALLAIYDWWFGLLAFFAGMQCLAGFQRAKVLAQIEQAPRYQDLACPSCGTAPLKGPFWRCHQCHTAFDTFANSAVCPQCDTIFPETACPSCGRRHPIADWFPQVVAADADRTPGV